VTRLALLAKLRIERTNYLAPVPYYTPSKMAARLCTPCTVCCGGLSDFFFPDDRPSPIFSTFAVLINLAILIYSAVVLGSRSCDSRPFTWIILGLVSAIVNIAFAVYLYTRFSIKVRHHGSSAGEAACHLFMYDWGVCLYILFAIWLVVWIVFSGTAASDANNDDNNDNGCGNGLVVMIVLMIIYMALGTCLIGCSVCTEGCRTPKWKRAHNANAQYNPGHARYDADAAHAHRHPEMQAPYGQPQQPQPYQQEAHPHRGGGIRGTAVGIFNKITDKVDDVVSGRKNTHHAAAPAQGGMHSAAAAPQQQAGYNYGGTQQPYANSANPPAQNPTYRYA
jgi:hypothetical protein